MSYQNYTERIEQLEHFYEQQQQSVDPSTLQASVLRQLIAEELIAQALQERDLPVNEDEIAARYQAVSEQAGGEQALNNRIKQLYGIDAQTYRHTLQSDLRREALVSSLDGGYQEWFERQLAEADIAIHDERIPVKRDTLY